MQQCRERERGESKGQERSNRRSECGTGCERLCVSEEERKKDKPFREAREGGGEYEVRANRGEREHECEIVCFLQNQAG